MANLLRKLWNDESGQAVVEYALVVGLIAIAVITTVMLFRDQLLALWTTVTGGLTSANAEVAEGAPGS